MQKDGKTVTQTKKYTLTERWVSVVASSDEKVLDFQQEAAGSGPDVSRHC